MTLVAAASYARTLRITMLSDPALTPDAHALSRCPPPRNSRARWPAGP